MNGFLFAMGSRVRIVESGEVGTVVGIAEFDSADPQFLLRYRSADGRAVQAWWTQNALEDAPANPVPAFEVKASDVTRKMLDLVDTGGGGGVDEAKPAVAEG